MKLTKSERNEVKSFINFGDDGLIHDSEQLEKNLIDFCNTKYRQKYKSDESYHHIRLNDYINLDGTELHSLIPMDNEFIERVSVVLYAESIKDRKQRGINVKGEPKTISPICTNDIGQKTQYLQYYQLHGEKIYLTFESVDNYSETSSTQWKCEQIQSKEYTERERAMDEAINSLFEKFYTSKHKNEILYKLLIHLNDNQLDYFSYESLSFFLQQELKQYRILDNQQKVLDRILLCGEIPNANQKKLLKRLFKISKKKQ